MAFGLSIVVSKKMKMMDRRTLGDRKNSCTGVALITILFWLLLWLLLEL